VPFILLYASRHTTCLLLLRRPLLRCCRNTTSLLPLQVRKLSVKRVTSPLTYDSFNNIIPDGLYDPAMGPVDFNSRCVDTPPTPTRATLLVLLLLLLVLLLLLLLLLLQQEHLRHIEDGLVVLPLCRRHPIHQPATTAAAARSCTTCGLGHSMCPGHFGHIELPVVVYNPLVFR
jgi:hypothetical protein